MDWRGVDWDRVGAGKVMQHDERVITVECCEFAGIEAASYNDGTSGLLLTVKICRLDAFDLVKAIRKEFGFADEDFE